MPNGELSEDGLTRETLKAALRKMNRKGKGSQLADYKRLRFLSRSDNLARACPTARAWAASQVATLNAANPA